MYCFEKVHDRNTKLLFIQIYCFFIQIYCCISMEVGLFFALLQVWYHISLDTIVCLNDRLDDERSHSDTPNGTAYKCA